MIYPGLNINTSEYNIRQVGNEKFAVIPFSDWLPPDFEDVVTVGPGFINKMYYSPSANMMVPSELGPAGVAISAKDLKYWLKALN